jgi:hypothetical protein
MTRKIPVLKRMPAMAVQTRLAACKLIVIGRVDNLGRIAVFTMRIPGAMTRFTTVFGPACTRKVYPVRGLRERFTDLIVTGRTLLIGHSGSGPSGHDKHHDQENRHEEPPVPPTRPP